MPDRPQPPHWNYRTAAHLLNRASFGGTPEEIKLAVKEGLGKTVERLLAPPAPATPVARPENIQPVSFYSLRKELQMLPEEQRKEKIKELRKEEYKKFAELREWWLQQMRSGPDPLREKMTLFWHGHFATSHEKVRSTFMLWQQNELFRAQALGNFGVLTKAVSRDPAMMVYLDTVRSDPKHPNENFARELMELFTLGEGHYTEQDIRESARAFTGYRIDQQSDLFRFADRQHDYGEKDFFGKKAAYDGDGIVDRILEQPQCARFITRKLLVFFAAENPDPRWVESLAAQFRMGGYEIRPLLRRIFTSPEFYSATCIGTQIKSPVQWLVQTSKLLETRIPGPLLASQSLRQMGQDLFAPPSVKGWDGGKAWISTSSLLLRYNLAATFLKKDAAPIVGPNRPMMVEMARPGLPSIDLAKLVPAEIRAKPEVLCNTLQMRLFTRALEPREQKAFLDFLAQAKQVDDRTVSSLLQLMMSTPQFQLC